MRKLAYKALRRTAFLLLLPIILGSCSLMRRPDPVTVDGFYKYMEGGAFVSEKLANEYREKVNEYFIISRYYGVDPEVDFIRQGDTGMWFVSERVVSTIVDVNDVVRERERQTLLNEGANGNDEENK